MSLSPSRSTNKLTPFSRDSLRSLQDGAGGNVTGGVTDICSEFYNETLAQENPLDNISHMRTGIHISLSAYVAAMLVALFGLKETKDWSPSGSHDNVSV